MVLKIRANVKNFCLHGATGNAVEMKEMSRSPPEGQTTHIKFQCESCGYEITSVLELNLVKESAYEPKKTPIGD